MSTGDQSNQMRHSSNLRDSTNVKPIVNLAQKHHSERTNTLLIIGELKWGLTLAKAATLNGADKRVRITQYMYRKFLIEPEQIFAVFDQSLIDNRVCLLNTKSDNA